MNQKDLGTVECIRGGPDACSPHMGHNPGCGHVQMNPRVNTPAQQAARNAYEAAMAGMGPAGMGLAGMPGMVPQHAQMHAGMGVGGGVPMGVYPGGIGAPMPPQGPQRVGVDVMGQNPNGAAYGAPWGAQGGAPGPVMPQLGQGNGNGGGNGGGYSNGGNGVLGAAPVAGGREPVAARLERTSLAIACAVIQGLTPEQFRAESSTIALDSVRAARALLDEVDGIIRMGSRERSDRESPAL